MEPHDQRSTILPFFIKHCKMRMFFRTYPYMAHLYNTSKQKKVNDENFCENGFIEDLLID